MEPKPKSDKWVIKNDNFEKENLGYLAWGANYVLIGDSHIARIREPVIRKIWEKYFGEHFLIFADGGNRIENVLWMVDRYNLPGGCDVAVIHIGGNNINRDSNPREIAKGIMKVAKEVHKKNKEILVFLTGIFPGRGKPMNIICKVNNILGDLTRYCKNTFFMKPDFSKWLDENGTLKTELDYGDHVHLSKKGYELFIGYIAEMTQLSEKFKQNCDVPYVPPPLPHRKTTSHFGIGEPETFYLIDFDRNGVPRGPWYTSQPPPPSPQPQFNQVPRETSGSNSVEVKCFGLPGSKMIDCSNGYVVHGGVNNK